MNDISDEARIRRQVEEHGGPQGLNALDQWRWKGMNLPDVRRKDYSAEREAQQDYVAVITAMENWGNWLRGQVEAMQADRKKLVDELNEELAAILDKVCDRLGEQDKTISALRAEISDLRIKQAADRVEQLNTLHSRLVDAAELTIKTFNEAASRRAELSEVERQQAQEVAVVEAKANALASELERLKQAQQHPKFAREEEPDEGGAFDLPVGFLPSRRSN